MTARRCAGVLVLAGCSFATGSLAAQDMPVPPEVQGAMFKKILAYDRALQHASEIRILMVGSGGNEDDEIVRKLSDAFRAEGLIPSVVGIEGLDDTVSPDSVVYMLPGADEERVREFCLASSVLSISGLPAYAEDGHVSISLDINERRAEIIVHLERLEAEGHKLSADMLELARVIR